MNQTFSPTQALPPAAVCPLCDGPNHCAGACGSIEWNMTTACWCFDPEQPFPKALVDTVPKAQRAQRCICQSCVARFAQTNRQDA